MHRYKTLLMLLICLSVDLPSFGFSLLGPYASWMDKQKDYQLDGDIGGPMDINEEYRWNVPVVTYGFDEAFLNAFGESGVSAVEEAIAVLNNLPPASEVNLDTYPLEAQRINFRAQYYQLIDLKSGTLSLLMESLGLGNPERWVFTLQDVQESLAETNFVVIQRNFDPISTNASAYINAREYTYTQVAHAGHPDRYYPIIVTVDPLAFPFDSTIATEPVPAFGIFYDGLTRDDVGGLRYLLDQNNRNVERLLLGITGSGTNSGNYVNTALRPGVEKLSFVRLNFDSAAKQFISITNTYVDTYLTNNQPHQQTVQRIIHQPDILFTAEDFGFERTTYGNSEYFLWRTAMVRTNASEWVNNDDLDPDSRTNGPGIIVPGRKISFNNSGKYYLAAGRRDLPSPDPQGVYYPENFSPNYTLPLWSSFGATTNAPIIHVGDQTAVDSITLHAELNPTNGFRWSLLANIDGVYQIDATTNLTSWEPVQVITNSEGIFTFFDTNLSTKRFYRAIKLP